MNPNHSSSPSLKIVVVGGSGLIGRSLVAALRARGHTVIVASPSHGINTVTGVGVTTALTGAHTIIDVSNSPSFEAGPVLEFFTRSTGNLLAAAKVLGVRHYVALSVVGADRLPHSGYMRAKFAQENLIRNSGLPHTIVRATQFFEFAAAIAHVATVGHEVRVPLADMQPVALADVSAILADIALAAPVNGLLELAGPEKLPQADFLRRELAAAGDPRPVIVDPAATYFGARLASDSLVPVAAAPLLAPTRHADWLAKRAAVVSASPAA
jgi:uncharacterized protein YbjT (DUF2867 family)